MMSTTTGVPVSAYRHHKPSSRATVTLNSKDFYPGPWNSPAIRAEARIGECGMAYPWQRTGHAICKEG